MLLVLVCCAFVLQLMVLLPACSLCRGANTGARLQQLDVLLGSNAQLAARLMQSTNNNGSTPLMVATTGILDEGHAAVFRRLLQAADAVVLATKTKSGGVAPLCSTALVMTLC